MKNIKYYILVYIILLQISCSKDENISNQNVPQPESENILPLKQGNTWNYKYTYKENGITISSRIFSFSFSYNITIGSEIWYDFFPKIDEQTPFPQIMPFDTSYTNSDISTLLTNRADGVWLKSLKGNYNILIYKYPGVEGETYSNSELKIISTQEDLTVDAGNFKCYVYSTNIFAIKKQPLGPENTLHYLAPNVGIIKALYSFQSPLPPYKTYDFIYELVSFTLY